MFLLLLLLIIIIIIKVGLRSSPTLSPFSRIAGFFRFAACGRFSQKKKTDFTNGLHEV
jgi:hypothetical protein